MGKRAGLIVAVVAVIVLVLAVLLYVQTGNPTIQGAIVGAVAGVTGGVLGASVTAWNTRQTTADTLRDAGNARQTERDDAKAARFADRIADLAAQLLDCADSYMTKYNKAIVATAARRKVPDWDTYDATPIGRVAQELKLVVLLPATHQAVNDFLNTLFVTFNFVPGTDGLTRDELGRWQAGYRAYIDAEPVFTNAIRVELGRPPIARRPVLPMPPRLPESMSSGHDAASPTS